jgi:hypothetical protein
MGTAFGIIRSPSSPAVRFVVGVLLQVGEGDDRKWLAAREARKVASAAR